MGEGFVGEFLRIVSEECDRDDCKRKHKDCRFFIMGKGCLFDLPPSRWDTELIQKQYFSIFHSRKAGEEHE